MTNTFDWAGLTAEIVKGHFAKYPVDLLHLLRTRIEAAFVQRVKYDHPTFVHRVDRARYHLALCSADRIGAMISFSDEENANLTARAEAAEARVKVLETQVDILEQALIDHNCGSPSCLCVGCIEKRDPALGDEHGK